MLIQEASTTSTFHRTLKVGCHWNYVFIVHNGANCTWFSFATWYPTPWKSTNLTGFVILGPIQPHTIVVLPNTSGLQLLMCYDNEGVYVDTYGKITKNVVLQWGELPTSVAYIGTGQIMGWGNKAIEIRWWSCITDGKGAWRERS